MIGEADFLGIGFFGWVDMLMSVPDLAIWNENETSSIDSRYTSRFS
jgi:hypothetical protein